MVIEAVSSVRSNGVYNSVSFEGKKHNKENKNGLVTLPSSLKAVPVAVLIAMSPMTETNAKEIMNPTQVEAVVEQTQKQKFDMEAYNKAVNYLLDKQPTKIPAKYQNDFNNIIKTINLRSYAPLDEDIIDEDISNSRAFLHLTKDNKLFFTFNKQNSFSMSEFMTYNIQPKRVLTEAHSYKSIDGSTKYRLKHYIIGEGWEQEMEEGLNDNWSGVIKNGTKPCKESSEIKVEITKELFDNLKELFSDYKIPLEATLVK